MRFAPFTSTIEDPNFRDLASAVYDIDQLLVRSETPIEDLADLPPHVAKALGKIGLEVDQASDFAILNWQLHENNPGQSIKTYSGSLWHGYIDSGFFKVFDFKELGYQREELLGLLAFRGAIKPDFTIYEPGARPGTTRLVENTKDRSNYAGIFARALDYPN